MSGWGSWFGGAAAQKKKEAPKNAILGLRSTMEMLNKREKHLQNQMDEQDAIARKYVNTNKAAAKAALRRKKGFEHSLEQTSNQIMTVEREISSIETANINKETLDAMQNASQALKQIHGNMTVDKVDDVMEKLREQHAVGTEIEEALAQGNQANALDEDELEEELEGLQAEELDNKMMRTGTVPQADQVQRLPTPASGELNGRAPAQEEDDVDKELRKMQAEMAM